MNLNEITKYSFKEEPTPEFCQSIPKFLYPFYLKKIFEYHMGEKLNLKTPKTFSEKIQWLKLHQSTSKKTRLTDKLTVRDYVKEKIGEEYLKKIFGVWNNYEEIDFDKLPEYFVLKTNHGWKNNVFYKKSIATQELHDEIKNMFKEVMNMNFAFRSGFELHYNGIQPKLFAEQLIPQIKHYEVMCFNGEPQFICIKYVKDNIFYSSWYNTKFERQPFKLQFDNCTPAEIDVEKAQKILELAKKLAENFTLVRCDFNISRDTKILFEEMTFTPYSGFRHFEPQKYDRILGEMIKLPNN